MRAPRKTPAPQATAKFRKLELAPGMRAPRCEVEISYRTTRTARCRNTAKYLVDDLLCCTRHTCLRALQHCLGDEGIDLQD